MNKNNVAIVYQTLIQGGLSPIQAAGVVGRFQQESGAELNTTAHGDRTIEGGSHGIGQWNRERKRNLLAFGGENWTDPAVQARFALHEMGIGENNGAPGFGSERMAGKALLAAQDIDGASAAAMHFERPQGYTAQNPRGGHGYKNTLRNAQGIFDQFGNSAPQPAQDFPNPMTDYSISPAEADAAVQDRAKAAQDMSNPISGYGGGPQAPEPQTMLAGKSPVPEAGIFGLRGKQKGEKETWRDKLAKGIADLGSFGGGGGAVPQIKSTPQIPTMMTQAPQVAPIDQNAALNQRQQLAMALSRLNSGKTFVG